MIVDGYIRVSQVNDRAGERFISPALQRDAIEGWARLHGAVVGELFEELDESGARTDRPLLERAIARVESGESGGIVVSRLDRFGRSLLDGLAGIDRITRAGGTFVAVEDGLDLSTDTGRLVLRLMLSLGEWELDRVRSTWRTAQERAIARGVHIGPAPIGYRRRDDGRLVPDPRYGPVVTELFQRRAVGAAIGELCRLLTERDLPTPAGARVWAWSTVDGLLRKRTYLGEVHHGAYVNRSAHAALVDPATWQAAQRPLEKRPARPDVAETLLRGLPWPRRHHPRAARGLARPRGGAAGRAGHAGALARRVRLFLDDVRRHDWAPGLSPGATYHPREFGRRPESLPRFLDEAVIARLEREDALERLPDQTTRTLVRILIETGLRAIDARTLPLDALSTDSAGAPYLRYFNHKLARERYLPITPGLAGAIREQQAAVRERFPGGEPCLLPRERENPDGSRPYSHATLVMRLRDWVRALDLRDDHGRLVAVTPHRFRHTVATRMINNGVPRSRFSSCSITSRRA